MYQWSSSGQGPDNLVKIGKLDMWVDTEVEEWIDARISERDADLVTGGAE